MRTALIVVAATVVLVGACGSRGSDPAGSPVESAGSGARDEQTTTTFGPTTTIDRVVLDGTWPLSGNWLVYPPGEASSVSGESGFAGLHVDITGDRLMSLGHGQCYVFGGRAVESNGLIQVVPLDSEVDVGGVECDPGPAPEAFADAVECLSAGCDVVLADDVLSLATSTGEPVADLIRTESDIPPTDVDEATGTTTTIAFIPTVVAVDRVYVAPDRKTVVVYAGDPLDACLSSDDGASVSVIDDILIVEARRLIPNAPPTTCLPMCNANKSTVVLTSPLAESVTVARSAPGSSATCLSVHDPVDEIPIEACQYAEPGSPGEAATTTLPVDSDPNLLAPC